MRLKNPPDANGTTLDRSVVGAVLVTPGGCDCVGGGAMVRRCDLRRRQRSRKSRNTRMKARPASPPTTPPTTAGVFIELPPPEPAPEVAEDDGAEAVLPEPPMPPTTPPVFDAELVGLNVEVCELAAADEKEVV